MPTHYSRALGRQHTVRLGTLMLALIGSVNACRPDSAAGPQPSPNRETSGSLVLLKYDEARRDSASLGKRHNDYLDMIWKEISHSVQLKRGKSLNKREVCRVFETVLVKTPIAPSERAVISSTLEKVDKHCALASIVTQITGRSNRASVWSDPSQGIEPSFWQIFDTLTYSSASDTLPTISTTLTRYASTLSAVVSAINSSSSAQQLSSSLPAILANAVATTDYEAELMAGLADVASSSGTYWEANGQAWYAAYSANGEGSGDESCDPCYTNRS